jgi:Lon protease-like protein
MTARKSKKRENGSWTPPLEIPVFPLPNVILFPEAEVPLYVFEPRYQKMLTDCRAGGKFLAVSLFKKGWENRQEPIPSHEIVGVGFLRAVFENADGTAYILLRGVGRAQIVRYLQMEPYRIAKIQYLPDEIQNPKELARLSRRLKKLFIQKLRWVSENPKITPQLPREMARPIPLSHLASSIVQISPYLKQDLLETTNSNCRIRHLIELLEEEIHPPGSQN